MIEIRENSFMIIVLKFKIDGIPQYWFDTFSDKDIAINTLKGTGYTIVEDFADFFSLLSCTSLKKALIIQGSIIELDEK